MKNHLDATLDRIVIEPPYMEYSTRARAEMLERVERVTTRFREVPKALASAWEYSILLYGSYGRGDANAESDLDIIFVTDHETRSQEIAQSLRSLLPGYAFNLRFLPVCPDQGVFQSLSYWLAVSSMRPVVGAVSTLDRFLGYTLEVLRQLPLREMLKLFATDQDHAERLNPTSPHFYNFKRGAGGTIEWDFVRLLLLWQSAHCKPVTHEQNCQLRTIYLHYQYIVTLKDFVRTSCRKHIETYDIKCDADYSEYWFFHPELAEEIFISCHAHVSEFIGSVPP